MKIIIFVYIMRFLYFLAAIGECGANGGLDFKLQILDHNLRYVYQKLRTKFDIVINCFNSYDIVYNFVRKYHFIGEIIGRNKDGHLVELWMMNPPNIYFSKYDYIFFILDDVQINNIDFYDLIRVKRAHRIEIISPKVLNSTHDFMSKYDNVLTLNNCLEVYCLLMTYNDFIKYLSMNTCENKYIWGVDFLFGHYKIRVGVYNKYTVNHKIKIVHDNDDVPCDAANKYLTSNGINMPLGQYISTIPSVIDIIRT